MPKKIIDRTKYWQNSVNEIERKIAQLEAKIADSDFKFKLLLDEVRANNDLIKKLRQEVKLGGDNNVS